MAVLLILYVLYEGRDAMIPSEERLLDAVGVKIEKAEEKVLKEENK